MKEKKGRLYKFYGKLTIRNKLLISCLPFVVLGYFLIFYSTTVIMFDQMKQMVYDQTEQNVMEKKKLVNTLLDNYNQATIKFLYYTDMGVLGEVEETHDVYTQTTYKKNHLYKIYTNTITGKMYLKKNGKTTFVSKDANQWEDQEAKKKIFFMNKNGKYLWMME